ncbi:tyrosine-type recombinase/integrase [Massilia sp. IC2-476]|uniref:tyrosine-type recombinase/integrase n=1 Tax=Massilia sp. IC2-476 TaxID=2887199 RepID=UPI001D10076B|nr:tyrosine-type recombinase/integrase [Massilia sp. IC2-476]MCC2974362.1 tyrosine-type recombinase/integrase [Massilia sp. IC2-476]
MVTFLPIDLDPLPEDSPQRLAASARGAVFRGMADEPVTDARSDAELAREYIGQGELSPKSVANTQKELYRFLTWCREEARKTFRQLTVADLNAYKEFIRNPPPEWISSTKWPRNDPRYRPFSGPLSDASRRQAMIAVKGLLGYAEQTGYLRRNPARLVRNVRAGQASRITRYLSPQAVAHAIEAVSNRVADTPAALRQRERDRFLLIAFAQTGARLNEIVGASMGAIYSEGDGRWWLDVMGKGAKPRRLPVPPAMLAALRDYRQAFGLLPQASRADRTPLVLSSRSKEAVRITDEAASEALKAVFLAASERAEALGDGDSAAALRQASTHWLRHSMLTKHANSGVQLKTLQDTAGHANIATTAAYLHKQDHERHDEILGSGPGLVPDEPD